MTVDEKMTTTINKIHLLGAHHYSRLSKAMRHKVGAFIVTKHGVIVPGYNGTPSGWDNNCEDEVNGVLVTKPEVIHAELNAILKCAKEGISCLDARLYVTLSPCVPCSAMIANAGIREVFYGEEYRDSAGVDNLTQHGLKCTFIDLSEIINEFETRVS